MKSQAARVGRQKAKEQVAEANELHRQWQRVVRERDGYRCQWPDCRYESLVIPVHHINERSQRPDLRYDVSNGVCLCWMHHDTAHHDPQKRAEAKALGLLGGETYELNRRAKS